MNINVRIVRALGLLAGSLAIAVGCGPMRGEFDTGPVGEDAPVSADAADVTRLDTPTLFDVPRGDAVRRCTGNADCTVGVNRVCNVSSGACVQCIPGGARTCTAGMYCGPMSTCIPGCNTSADCDPGDGGTPMRCDTVTHMCQGCMGDAECSAGQVCRSGACVAGCSATRPCAGGSTCCNGVCADTMNDIGNCGVCGQRCGNVNATATCTLGTCRFTCTPGYGNCDLLGNNGCEEPLAESITNCGMCSHFCQFTNAMGSCNAGTCAITSCDTGFQDCDRNGDNGCEANVATNPMNCGRCGRVCDVANGQTCNGGTCGCPAGSMACGTPARCVNTTSDPMNCGACGNMCPAGQICFMGGCTSSPPVRYTMMPGPSLPFIDACAVPGHATILAGTDDGSAPSTLPFAVRYWATNLPAGAPINISSNGHLFMSATGSAGLSGSIPPGGGLGLIAAHWLDLVQRMGVCVATVGVAPNRQFVVEWNDSNYYAGAGNLTFEIVINEGSNIIDIAYQTLTGGRAGGVGLTSPMAPNMISGCPAGMTTCLPAAGARIRFSPSP